MKRTNNTFLNPIWDAALWKARDDRRSNGHHGRHFRAYFFISSWLHFAFEKQDLTRGASRRRMGFFAPDVVTADSCYFNSYFRRKFASLQSSRCCRSVVANCGLDFKWRRCLIPDAVLIFTMRVLVFMLLTTFNGAEQLWHLECIQGLHTNLRRGDFWRHILQHRYY